MKKNILIYLLSFALILLAQQSFGQSRALEALEKGRRALALGDYSTAQQELEYSRKLNPTTPYVYAFLAKAYYYQSDLDKAIYAYNKSLETDYISRANGMVELIYHNSVSLGLEEQQSLSPAVMYYQKGRLHHLKGNIEKANEDLEKSLTINPYFEESKLYLEHIRSGQGPLLIESPITSDDIKESASQREKRPESGRRSNRGQQSYESLRYVRSIYFQVEKPKRRSEKKYLEKEGRKKFSQGQKLIEPKVGYATQTYIKIESMQFTSNQTVVNFLIENPSRDSLYTLRLDQDFVMMDRTGGRAKSYRMARISKFKREGTRLSPGGKVRFTVVFPDIPKDLSYVNIVEGNRNDGQQWNFYDIRLFD